MHKYHIITFSWTGRVTTKGSPVLSLRKYSLHEADILPIQLQFIPKSPYTLLETLSSQVQNKIERNCKIFSHSTFDYVRMNLSGWSFCSHECQLLSVLSCKFTYSVLLAHWVSLRYVFYMHTPIDCDIKSMLRVCHTPKILQRRGDR